ncbi:MAG TPA: 2,3,4,5-tetrahydropyridine-2,6-dicarboxylate N-succinyltransferase, partial [Alphaproteobacteria bacterium]|nr:2,3,4,5-tetrahydropyridine-2,6-dicarboxylate N-succinyltransferase [Alphaproteobacteria bacterium]
MTDIEARINAAWDNRDAIDTKDADLRAAVDHALDQLDSGKARVASREADGSWTVHQWLKKAVLLSFRLNPMAIIP